MDPERDTIAMTNRYTKRDFENSEGENFPGADIPYIVNLREWANRRVREDIEARRRPLVLPPIKTYKVPGSSGNVYTITISENNDILCTCPGFVYRRSCKHTKKNLYKGGN